MYFCRVQILLRICTPPFAAGERVGDEHTRRVDLRLIAATNRNLRAESE
jgi:transcriptional regulator with GAF, ATPase, and Fis domain